MRATVYREFTFEAAHCLPLLPEDHVCHRMHGHSYKVRIYVTGTVGEDGMVIDYDEISRWWRPVFDQIDHRVLNDVPGLERPTTEVLAEWVMRNLRVPHDRTVQFIRGIEWKLWIHIQESHDTGTEYPPADER